MIPSFEENLDGIDQNVSEKEGEVEGNGDQSEFCILLHSKWTE